MPAAAGHGEVAAFETAAEPSLNDLAQVAGHERDHPDAVSRNYRVQRPGNRAANQRADAKLRQAKRLPNRHVVRQDLLGFRDDSSRMDLGNMNPPGDVKDRRDPIVPVRKCRFHHMISCPSSTRRLIAILVPTSKHIAK
jgi:hypothetical protein